MINLQKNKQNLNCYINIDQNKFYIGNNYKIIYKKDITKYV